MAKIGSPVVYFIGDQTFAAQTFKIYLLIFGRQDDFWPQSCPFKKCLSLSIVFKKYENLPITARLKGGRAQNIQIPENMVSRKP